MYKHVPEASGWKKMGPSEVTAGDGRLEGGLEEGVFGSACASFMLNICVELNVYTGELD